MAWSDTFDILVIIIIIAVEIITILYSLLVVLNTLCLNYLI